MLLARYRFMVTIFWETMSIIQIRINITTKMVNQSAVTLLLMKFFRKWKVSTAKWKLIKNIQTWIILLLACEHDDNNGSSANDYVLFREDDWQLQSSLLYQEQIAGEGEFAVLIKRILSNIDTEQFAIIIEKVFDFHHRTVTQKFVISIERI